jgi:hypothetical protein
MMPYALLARLNHSNPERVSNIWSVRHLNQLVLRNKPARGLHPLSTNLALRRFFVRGDDFLALYFVKRPAIRASKVLTHLKPVTMLIYGL